MSTDLYKTITKATTEVLYKDRKSKFIGYAFPLDKLEAVKPILESLKKKHHNANHACYAWQLGADSISYRANDDGEPNNSAGMPIYGQIQAFDLTNVLVVVIRVFGGTKLGVGGLIQAYRTAAKMALESADIVEKLLEDQFKLEFDYAEMDKVMRMIKKHKVNLISQNLTNKCVYVIGIRKSESDLFENQLQTMHKIKINKLL